MEIYLTSVSDVENEAEDLGSGPYRSGECQTLPSGVRNATVLALTKSSHLVLEGSSV